MGKGGLRWYSGGWKGLDEGLDAVARRRPVLLLLPSHTGPKSHFKARAAGAGTRRAWGLDVGCGQASPLSRSRRTGRRQRGSDWCVHLVGTHGCLSRWTFLWLRPTNWPVVISECQVLVHWWGAPTPATSLGLLGTPHAAGSSRV